MAVGPDGVRITLEGFNPRVVELAAVPPPAAQEAALLEDPLRWISYKKNIETLYFIAGILLFVVALAALAAALFQSRHARKARLAAVYLQISKDWDRLEPDRENIRKFLNGRAYDACGAEILQIVTGNYYPIIVPRGELEESIDTILSYTEEVGHLCRKGYLRSQDMVDIIGDGLTMYLCILKPFMRGTRANGDRVTSKTYYANSIWLYGDIAGRPRFGLSARSANRRLRPGTRA